MTITVYNQNGDQVKEITLNKDIFGSRENAGLVHRALVHQLSNERIPIAHTKTRGQVHGGGRKPYRQKGTGNARQGSIRAPHYKGGGVVFGPSKNRNFSIKMPKKQRRAALFSLLSTKAKNKKIMALDKYDQEKPKTKLFAELIKKLGIARNVLVVIPKKDLIVQKSSLNLPTVKTILVNYLNPRDLLNYDQVLFFEESFEKMENLFLNKSIVK